MKENLCISSADVIQEAIKSSNKSTKDFEIDPNVLIIFSGLLLNYLREEANLEKFEWLMPFHPYAAPEHIYRGKFQDISITVLTPPMGASPMASIAEDLINCGAKTILLVCGSWGIGENVKLLDYIIPTHGLGIDGTTIHYSRGQDEETELNKAVIDVFINETKKRTKNYHIGKNFCKEAFYQINKEEIYDIRTKGCISIENGELNVLATICNQHNIEFGAIFYSYCNPLEGWKIPWGEDQYIKCVQLEGDIALGTLIRLNK
jgi:uridine phosphorylase